MKKGVIPKDEGVEGLSNLGLWGGTHVFPPLFDWSLFLVSSNLVNLFNASAGG